MLTAIVTAAAVFVAGLLVVASHFRTRRWFAEKQVLLAQWNGRYVIIVGFSMLSGVGGVLDATPAVANYVHIHKNDGTVRTIFVGDVWSLRDGGGNLIARW